MMAATDSSISKVTTLLAERRKYEGWLSALDQRRATTPDHVFTRVRADYVARLEAVVAELGSSTDALEGRVRELEERAGALKAEAQAIQDARSEAELRAHVGELAQDEWERAAAEADAKLQALEGERGTIHEELTSIRDMLSAARAPTPAAAAPVVVAEPSPPVEAEPPAARAVDAPAAEKGSAPEVTATGASEDAAGGDAPIESPTAPGRASGGFDELAFLRDITGAAPNESSPAPAPPPEEPAPAPRAQQRPVDDTLGLVLPNDAPAITPTRRASVEVPMAANVASNSPIVIKPEAARQGKTLKCTECGSMNYPTEWYCERCGAELSAL